MVKSPKRASAPKRSRKRVESYQSYLYRVLKQVHNDTGISKRGMETMNDLTSDLFERLNGECRNILQNSKKATLSAREVQSAVRLAFPGELAKHAVSEGTKAVTKFTSKSNDGGKGSSGKGGSGKGGSGRGGNKKAVSRSSKAGLQFPVGRVARFQRNSHVAERISADAPVYMAAVMEYIAAEVLELAGNKSKDLKVKRITPRHIQMALKGDEELDILFPADIAHGGVIPHIHKALIKPKKGGKKH